jgi:hypothetical protein
MVESQLLLIKKLPAVQIQIQNLEEEILRSKNQEPMTIQMN